MLSDSSDLYPHNAVAPCPTNPPIHQSTNPPIHQSTNPPIHQSTNPPIHQSTITAFDTAGPVVPANPLAARAAEGRPPPADGGGMRDTPAADRESVTSLARR